MLISAIKTAVEPDSCFSAAAHHNSKAYDSFIPGLPDNVAMICLASVHREDFLVIGAVCKRWRSFIQSKYFRFVRKGTGILKEWLYSYSTDNVDSMIQCEVMSSAKVKVWRIPPMPGLVDAGFSTVALDGKMLIIGGYSKKIGRRSPSADVHQYDARFNSVVQTASYTSPTIHMLCDFYQRYLDDENQYSYNLYVIGTMILCLSI